MTTARIIVGDVRTVLGGLPERSVQLCMTSPPYWALRSYLPADHAAKALEMGSEPTPDAYITGQVEVFRAVRRVLRDDGCIAVNLGDCYADKCLQMIPERVALALVADGWLLRSKLPWVKRSAMPESIRSRPASAVEYVFLLAKSERYYWDAEAVKQSASPNTHSRGTKWMDGITFKTDEPGSGNRNNSDFQRYMHDLPAEAGRNFRNSDLWFQSIAAPHGLCGVDDELVGLDVTAEPTKIEHFAAYPSRLVEPFVKAGTSEKGCCPACGKPWERMVERKNMVISSSGRNGRLNGVRPTSGTMVEPPRSTTVGWQPACDCPEAEPVPCTVLDPFNGTGTTGVVACRHGRYYIGIELSEAYAAASERRIERALKPQTHRADVSTEAPLFTGGDTDDDA